MDLISQITSTDLFVRLTKALLSAEYKDFQTIDDSGGDAGNDGYLESEEMLFQIYCPEKPEKADNSVYKTKIKKDLDKAKKLIDSGKYKIKDWVFITPRELTEPVQTYLRVEATSRGMNGIAWSGTTLEGLFSKHNHLRSQFPDLIQPDIEKQLRTSTTQIIGHMGSLDDVKKECKTRLEQGFQRRIDQAKPLLDQGKYETAKKEYEAILNEFNSGIDKIDSHIYFRVCNNLGVCEYNLGNLDKAADLFEKAYTAEPDLPMAISKYALSKLLKGVPAEGLPVIEELLEKHPNDDEAISVKANILHDLERYSDLIPFLRHKGKIALVHRYEGLEQMSKKDYEAAITSFENVVRLEPKNVEALMLIAQNVMVGMREVMKDNSFFPDRIPEKIMEKFNRAIACLKEASRLLRDTERKEDLEMIYANLSGCYVAIGMYEESIALAEEATSIDQNSAIPFLNKGISQLRLGRYQDAKNSLQTYKNLGGEGIDAEKHIAFCALKTGDLSSAEKIISMLLEDESGINIDIAELAVDFYSRKLDAEKLNSLLDRLEKEYPDNSQALRLRGSYMQRLGLGGAEILMQRALENAKSESEKMLAEIDLADLRYDLRDYSGAAELYKKYLSTKEGNQATYRYAQCLYNSGQYGALIDWIDVLSSSARCQLLIEQLEAYSNLYLGNLDKASQIFRDLFEKNPSNLQYLVYYGMCRFRLGKEKDAKVAFDTIKNRVKEAQDLIILAGGYQFIGEWDTAVDLTFKALEGDTNNPNAHLAFIFTFLKREQAVGKEPEEKYVKAFQKSIGEFNSRFPEEKALQGFEVKDGDVSQILKVVDQMAETTDNATNLYKESQAPIAIIPRLTGKKPFDVWVGFTQMREVGVKMSFGTADEIKNEMSAVEGRKDGSIVADIYPLFLLAHLGQLGLLSQLFKKIYVHQSVMDELTETLEDCKVSARKGVSMIGKVDGRHRMTEIPPEQVKENLDLLEKVRDFVSSNPSVEIRGFSKEKPKEERNIVNALDDSTRDSILLSQELGIPFYCDDRILRVVVDTDYGLRSFSSQSLFVVAHKNKLISLDMRYELQKMMIDLNYEFIPIDAAFIVSQLKNVGHRVEDIHSIIRSLTRKETSMQSLGAVLADLFIILMLDKTVAVSNKLHIFKYILKEASLNHDLASIEECIFANLQHGIRPEKHEKLKQLIGLIFKG